MKFLLSCIAAALAAQSAAAAPLPVDTDAVEYGPVRYRLVHQGEIRGEMYYELERRGGDILIHDGTTMLPDVRESLTGVFDAGTLAPKSILVDGDFSRTVLDIDLVFADGKVSGDYAIKRPGETAKTVSAYEAPSPAGAILRPAFFGLAAGLPLEEGARFEFTWFAPLSQGHAEAVFTITGTDTVETPAGTFETFVGELKAQPENILYITTEAPHKVVRIDVVGQEMVFERLPDAAPRE